MESKLMAQKLILRKVRRKAPPAVFVNPTFMIGDNDTKPGSGVLMLSLYWRKNIGHTAGGRNFVHVRDDAAAACNATDRGRVGEWYIAGHKNLFYREFYELVLKILDMHFIKLLIPDPLAFLGGLYAEMIGRSKHVTPICSRPVAQISCQRGFYSPARAVRELGMPQTPVETAVRDAIEWFREQGIIRR